jgi:hypothetical protein
LRVNDPKAAVRRIASAFVDGVKDLEPNINSKTSIQKHQKRPRAIARPLSLSDGSPSIR